MTFKIKHNLFSLPRVQSVKQWGLGWTVSEAVQAARRQEGAEPTRRSQGSGYYALLVGFDRH